MSVSREEWELTPAVGGFDGNRKNQVPLSGMVKSTGLPLLLQRQAIHTVDLGNIKK